MIVGHEALRAELEENLPPVTLLLGPSSVGKTALAQYLARHHQLLIQFPSASPLSAAAARELVTKATIRGYPWCFIVALDGATETAQNILLKVLEEPPEHVRFVLTASLLPLPTVASRAQVRRMGLLDTEQVADILVLACGFSLREASEAAAYSGGQVSGALRAAASTDSRILSVVSAALRAALDGGGSALDLAARSWSPEHTEVLRSWAAEAGAGRWERFSGSFAPGATTLQARRVIQVLNQYAGARNAAAVALASAFSEER